MEDVTVETEDAITSRRSCLFTPSLGISSPTTQVYLEGNIAAAVLCVGNTGNSLFRTSFSRNDNQHWPRPSLNDSPTPLPRSYSFRAGKPSSSERAQGNFRDIPGAVYDSKVGGTSLKTRLYLSDRFHVGSKAFVTPGPGAYPVEKVATGDVYFPGRIRAVAWNGPETFTESSWGRYSIVKRKLPTALVWVVQLLKRGKISSIETRVDFSSFTCRMSRVLRKRGVPSPQIPRRGKHTPRTRHSGDQSNRSAFM